eukprot:scaffold17877_cov151-Skeletonema_marinoi.AAC.1
MGGQAPQHVTHVLINESVEVIEESAFDGCENLVQVETHDGIREVERGAFIKCKLIRRINLKSVVEIGTAAFYQCENLESVEFGDKLETIGEFAFTECRSLEHLRLPSIITIEEGAFAECSRLIDVEFSERLETIGGHAFYDCKRLQRIAIPLKRGLIPFDDMLNECNQFDKGDQLTTVDLAGGAHTKTVSSFHMECWTTEMQAEINRIKQVLPDEIWDKTIPIRQWKDSVIDKMDHYKAEHYRYVKEGVTLLELALWKAKLDEKEDNCVEGRTKKAKVDVESARRERRGRPVWSPYQQCEF